MFLWKGCVTIVKILVLGMGSNQMMSKKKKNKNNKFEKRKDLWICNHQ